MKRYRAICWILAIVLCLAGCSAGALLSGNGILKPGDAFPLTTDLQVIGGNVFVQRPDAEGTVLYQLVGETEQPIWVCSDGNPVFSEFHCLYFFCTDGELGTYDPVTGKTETLLKTETTEHRLAHITEHYALFRHREEADYLVNLETGAVKEAEGLWSNTYVMDSRNDRLLVWEDSTGTLGFYDCETLTISAVHTETGDSAFVSDALAMGDTIYIVDEVGRLKRLNRQDNDTWSAPKTVSMSNETVFAVDAVGGVLCFISREDGTSNLAANVLHNGTEKRIAVERWNDSDENLQRGDWILSAADGWLACGQTSQRTVRMAELPIDPTQSEEVLFGPETYTLQISDNPYLGVVASVMPFGELKQGEEWVFEYSFSMTDEIRTCLAELFDGKTARRVTEYPAVDWPIRIGLEGCNLFLDEDGYVAVRTSDFSGAYIMEPEAYQQLTDLLNEQFRNDSE